MRGKPGWHHDRRVSRAKAARLMSPSRGETHEGEEEMKEAYKAYVAHADACESCFRAQYYGNQLQCPEGRCLEREALRGDPTEQGETQQEERR